MPRSKVSRKGLVNIPSEVRRKLGIEEGDIIAWIVDARAKTATIKVLKNPAKKLRGKYNDPQLTYEKVEEIADRLVEVEADASNRA